MRAAITGATGLLGGNLAIELRNQGWDVVATKRASSKTQHLDAYDIDWVDASLTDADSLVRAFDTADVIFHCAAAVSIRMEIQPWIHEANIVGTERVIEASRTVGARLVHCSTVGAIGVTTNGEPCTEEHVWNLAEVGLDDAYATTKFQSQELVLREAGDGLDAVIVNPTYMIGPYDSKPSSGKLVQQIVQGRMPGNPTGWNNFVDVRDVARGMVTAAERGKAGELHILGGRNMPYREFIQLVADVAGCKPPSREIPHWLGSIVGWIGDVHSSLTGSEPLLNGATVRWGECDGFIFSSDKAKRVLNYEISPLEPAIADCVKWFRENGLL